MAKTRLGLYGGPRSPYGDFTKAAPSVKTFSGAYVRLGLYGGSRSPYGSFAGKTAGIPATAKRSKQFLRTVGRMIR